jgi:hypothetical protein
MWYHWIRRAGADIKEEEAAEEAAAKAKVA